MLQFSPLLFRPCGTFGCSASNGHWGKAAVATAAEAASCLLLTCIPFQTAPPAGQLSAAVSGDSVQQRGKHSSWSDPEVHRKYMDHNKDFTNIDDLFTVKCSIGNLV